MTERIWIGFAALAGAIAAAGDVAFRHLVDDSYRVGLGLIASRYGFYHALALIAAAILRRNPIREAQAWLFGAGWCFFVGQILFCGPLYLIGAGVAGWSGRFIIPGLVILVAGWLSLFVHMLL
jgi:uncharacterized membrane protein YgdD (TMEM256/DUF423 family)